MVFFILLAFRAAKIVQGERNAKGNEFHFQCRAAAYFRIFKCKGTAKRDKFKGYLRKNLQRRRRHWLLGTMKPP